jgi:hypothetical protein
MTTPQLYAVYSRSYREYDRESGAPEPRGASHLEAIVAEFAAHDAQNGTPLRSPEQFQRAVATGLEALGPLGLQAA